jgi:hypothetical protein
MNVEQYKAAVIRKLAEMVKRKNYEPEKLDIDEISTSFFDEFAEFVNFNETTFALELLVTSKDNFLAKIKMK